MPHTAATRPLAEVGFSIPSMVCDGCAEKIRHALAAIPGIRSVKPKLWRKRVQVRYEPSKVQECQIKDALATAAYSAVEA